VSARWKSNDCGWSSPVSPLGTTADRDSRRRVCDKRRCASAEPSAAVRTDAPRLCVGWNVGTRNDVGWADSEPGAPAPFVHHARRGVCGAPTDRPQGYAVAGPSDAARALRGEDCCMRMMAAEPDAVDPIVEATARRVVELLRLTPVGVGLVDAAVVADHLGVSRGWVYRHADALGAVRLGRPTGADAVQPRSGSQGRRVAR
jgi:hypothetical protein